jgi:hypothetical protein
MRKFSLPAVFFFVSALSAFAQQYDHDAVVKVMRNNAASLGAITAAAGKNDYSVAAEKLVSIASGMQSLLALSPPKGSKEEWDKDLKALLNAVYRGIGSCGNQDAAGLQTAINDIKAAMKNGHQAFRG